MVTVDSSAPTTDQATFKVGCGGAQGDGARIKLSEVLGPKVTEIVAGQPQTFTIKNAHMGGNIGSEFRLTLLHKGAEVFEASSLVRWGIRKVHSYKFSEAYSNMGDNFHLSGIYINPHFIY